MKPCKHPCCPDKGPCRKPKKQKTRYKIRPFSKKRVKENKKYSALRKKFLEDHPVCEAKLEGCTGVAVEVHHSRGHGIYFLDVKTFKAMCSNCHGIVERKPKMAKKKGLSKSRIT